MDPDIPAKVPLRLLRFSRRWRNVLPALVSAALVGWLFVQSPPAKVAEAAAALDWPQLALATALLVLGLYLWDAVCLRWLFATMGWPLPFRAVLHARGSSYLVSAFNYELGQGMLAWKLSQDHGIPVLQTLTGCLLLACHDLAVLLALGLTGALLSPDFQMRIVVICVAGIVTLVALAILASRIGKRRQEGWLASWSAGKTACLLLLRGAYYGLILAYAAVGLDLCNIRVDGWVVAGVISLVLLADGLPFSISGLGTRENVLRYLLPPEHKDVVVAFSLIWSTGLIAGRLALGLAHTWIPRLMGRSSGHRPRETT